MGRCLAQHSARCLQTTPTRWTLGPVRDKTHGVVAAGMQTPRSAGAAAGLVWVVAPAAAASSSAGYFAGSPAALRTHPRSVHWRSAHCCLGSSCPQTAGVAGRCAWGHLMSC